MDERHGQPGDSSATGDAAAFERDHARLAGWVKRMFRERCGSRVDIVEELSQRTWAGVWEAVSSKRYDPARAAMTTFVYAVAQNIWRQWAKQQARSEASSVANGEESTGAQDAVATVAEAELIDVVRACVHGRAPAAGLTDDEREVLRLIAAGETDRALAERLGVAPSTAHARKKAAMDKLRGYLTGKFGGTERGAASSQ
ncbi:MAG: RNA polymerase sigma factor [Phycisphaerales bacterium]